MAAARYGGKQTVTAVRYGGKTPLHTTHGTRAAEHTTASTILLMEQDPSVIFGVINCSPFVCLFVCFVWFAKAAVNRVNTLTGQKRLVFVHSHKQRTEEQGKVDS